MLAVAIVTAVATAVLAVFVIVTAIFAIRAFRKQSAEVETLTAQAEDQRETNKKLATPAGWTSLGEYAVGGVAAAGVG
jgi:hypothetical protein